MVAACKELELLPSALYNLCQALFTLSGLSLVAGYPQAQTPLKGHK